MGFESSRAARRRLAALSLSNDLVHEALTPASNVAAGSNAAMADAMADSIPGLMDSGQALQLDMRDIDERKRAAAASIGAAPTTSAPSPLARELDELAFDIMTTPGAGGALLTAFAAQTRALTMVLEAAKRASGAPLPPAVLFAAQAALHSPKALASLASL